jgi:hypothetical protein
MPIATSRQEAAREGWTTLLLTGLLGLVTLRYFVIRKKATKGKSR